MNAQIILSLLILGAAATAVFSVRLVRAAIGLVIGNSALALLMVVQGAPYAGIVQISVGVGILSVLFLVAISLTETMGRDADET